MKLSKIIHMSRSTRRSLAKLIKKAILIGLTSLMLFGGFNYINRDKSVQLNEKTKIEKVTKEIKTIRNEEDIDIARQILDNRINRSKVYVEQVKSNKEIILMEVNGFFDHNNVKNKKENWLDILGNSQITLKGNYQVLITMLFDKLDISISPLGVVNVNYDPSDIIIKSVNVDTKFIDRNKDILGKEYSDEEVLALEKIIKSGIIRELQCNDTLNACKLELEDFMKSVGTSLGVHEMQFNNGNTIEVSRDIDFEKKEIPLAGKDNMYLGLENIKYIVIHNTDNPDAGAAAHYKYYNSDKNANVVHFVIDANKVIQCLPLYLQAEGVGINKEWDANGKQKIYNSNSISIEICNNGSPEEIKQAEELAIKFIRDVLMKQLPNAKIVTHKQATGKQCPSTILGRQDGWKDFTGKLGVQLK